jgi:hypothetical protein
MQVLNVLLRFAWLQTVLNFQVSFPHAQTLSAIVASLADYGTFSGNIEFIQNVHKIPKFIVNSKS